MTSMHKVDRRAFLRGSLALGGLAAFPLGAPGAGSIERKSISATGFPAQTLESYKRAIRAMLSLPPENPHNWYRFALIHLLDCPHRNYWFLPWHRAYLWYFQSIIQKYSGDPTFALPYWDWTATPKIPDQMWDDVLTPTASAYLADGNAFRQGYQAAIEAFYRSATPDQQSWMQKRGFPNAQSLISSAVNAIPPRQQGRSLTRQNPNLTGRTAAMVALSNINQSVLAPRAFTSAPTVLGFGSYQAQNHYQGPGEGPLESQPHDSVHGAIGGYMGQFMSPSDPIFWLHHGNIDRLWTVWTAGMESYHRPAYPDEASWGSETFLFFVNADGQKVSTTAGEWKTPKDYSYQRGSGTMPPNLFAAAEANPLVALEAPVANAAFGNGGNAQASTAVSAPPDFIEVTLDIPIGSPATDFAVLLDSSNPEQDAVSDSEHLVGIISPFAVGHHAHDGQAAETLTVQIPIAAKFAALKAANLIAGTEVKIDVEPLEGPPAPAAGGGRLALIQPLTGLLRKAAPAATVRSVRVVGKG